jgi:hypothetical protein
VASFLFHPKGRKLAPQGVKFDPRDEIWPPRGEVWPQGWTLSPFDDVIPFDVKTLCLSFHFSKQYIESVHPWGQVQP